MDQPTPETPDEPATNPPAASSRRYRAEARLRSRIDDEPIVAWTRGWVSHEQSLHRVLAARTLDVAVLTDTTLSLVTTGFLSRRPRRRVYAADLGRIRVADVAVRSGRRLVVTSDAGDRLRIELPGTPRATAFADALVARAGAPRP